MTGVPRPNVRFAEGFARLLFRASESKWMRFWQPQARKRTVIFLLVSVACALFFVVGPTSASAQTWSNGYGYRRTITIDHTKVANTDQFNFPVAIAGTYSYLATTSNGGNVTSSNGYDIIFTLDPAGATVLAFEQESYNATTGAVAYWVLIPALSHAIDTTIYMFYGNSSVTTDQSNKTGVWDGNYQGVWHFANGSTVTTNDSSSSGNNGMFVGVTATSGQIDGAGSFDGSTSTVSTTKSFTWPLTVTSEAWVNTTSSSGHKVSAIENAQTGTGSTAADLNLYVDTNGKVVTTCYTGFYQTITSTSAVNDGNWHHLAATLNNSTKIMTLYVDGSSQGTMNCNNAPSFTGYFRVGSYALTNYPNGSNGYFNGKIDEVRLSIIDRSADWIATEYNNQKSPSTFYTVAGANPPTIASISPGAGTVGTAVKITGAGFGSTQGSSTVTFGGTTASPTSWSSTSIVVPVPSGATSGNVVVTVSGTASNGVWFVVPGTLAYGYSYERALTISHTQVPNSDQLNFPLLVSGTYSYLATTSNGGNVTSSSGYDIIFTSDAGGMNTLPFEQESYNAATGAVNYWVKIPSLSHTTDTVIYMFYGNSAVTTDQSSKTAVWDSGYKGVWHLGDNAANTNVADSTANANTLTNQVNTSSKTATGEIGNGLSYNGSSDYSSISNNPSIDIQGSTITLEAWAKPTNSTASSSERLIVKEVPGNTDPYVRYGLFRAASGSSQLTFYLSTGGSGSAASISGGSTSAGTWTHVVGVYNGSTVTLYVNGASVATTSKTGNIASGATPLVLGADTAAGVEYFNGTLDEVRISNSARSGDWIAAEYNNQSNPSVFYSVAGANPPNIISLSSTSGSPGTSITITGSFFGSTQGSSTVTFGGTAATPTSWSNTSIAVPVPSGATSGDVVVTVAGVPSNAIWFTVPGTMPYGSGFTYWRRITIDHTKVPHTDQINFPVLISGTYSYLATTSNGGNVVSPNGYDIVFTSDAAGANTLEFEQESYNASTGAVNYWVKVPKVSHATDTSIYMFYGNPGITTDQSNKTGVWDSNYQGVWHLPNGTSLTANDSTILGHNAALKGSTTPGAVTGKIDGGGAFNGSTAYIDVTGNGFLEPATAITISGWVNYTTVNSNAKIYSRPYRSDSSWSSPYTSVDLLASDGTTGKPRLDITIGGTQVGVDGSSTINDGTWHYVVGTYDGSLVRMYLDGQLSGSASQAGAIDYSGATEADVTLGSRSAYNNGDFLNGSLDEIRVSSIARSADWIATEYNNQNSPSTFYAVSGTYPATITSLSPTSGSVGTSVTITGTGFGSTQGSSTVTFSGISATPTSWGNTSITVSVPSGAITGNVVVTVSSAASNGAWFTVLGTWANSYTYQRALTVSHAKVSNTDQFNFPVLVSGTYSYLATTSNGGNVTNSNGYDIIFTSDPAGTSVLPFEQESYNPSTGAINYWVQIPVLSHTADTSIYMFYGNSGITTDQSNKTAVWDSNYLGVWHSGESSGNLNDSTINSNPAVPTSLTQGVTGQIGNAAVYNGGSSHAAVGNLSLFSPTTISVSAWVKPTSYPNSYNYVLSKEQTSDPYLGFDMRVDGGNLRFFIATGGAGSSVSASATQPSTGAWHYVVGSYDGSNLKLYVDGSLANSVAHTGNMDAANASLWFGDSASFSGRTWNGSIDEVRLSGIARSADWIAAEYNNQGNPSAFYSFGAANPPSISSLSPASGTVGTTVTIAGSFFGSTQGSSTVTFGGAAATPTSWSATSITVPVPTGAASGNVVVTVSGVASNPVWFGLLGAWPNHYNYQRAITIDHTKVPNTDQVNFPVLISGTYSYLATMTNGGNVANSNAYDIVFASDPAGFNPLAFEQDSYNAATGAVNYWVKIPTLSHTNDTTIYMFYGNPSITSDQSNKPAVWDSNFVGVWHFPNGTTLAANDSTRNANNGTISGPTATTGEIDGGASFTGGTNNISISAAGSLVAPFTIEEWAKPASVTNYLGLFGSRSPSDGSFDAKLTTSGVHGDIGTGSSWLSTGADATFSYSANTWHHFVYVVSTSGYTIYGDGSQIGSGSLGGTALLFNSTHTLTLGATPVSGENFNGVIDEARVSSSVRSGDWIATEYHNQSSPSTFYSVSSQAYSTEPVISSLSPSSGGASTSVTISGVGFGTSQGTSTVTFNGTAGSPTSWSGTSITVPVPSGATSGNVVVTVAGMTSNPAPFTVTGGLSGTVTKQSDGTAISGATVQVLQDRNVAATTTTASNGTYSISSLGTGEYDVEFSASGFGTVLQSAVTVPASGATLNQVLGTPGTISGQVTQSNGTTAISGATVTVLQSSESVGTATTNGTGNYSVSTLGAGSYEVEASATGYVNQGLSGVSVSSGNTTTENFSLNALGAQPVSYVYDNLGRLTAAIDQAGNVAVYAYDPVGNILSISRGSAQQLSVMTFSPGSGPVGSTVTIYGTAFSTTPSQNTVKFNGTTATVTSATVTSLVVTVPLGATTGTISVTTSAGTATSSASFTVTAAGAGQPTITSFTPSIGTPGTSVSISGTNFETASANDKLKFNTALSRTSSATTTSLSVSVPNGGTSGHLALKTPSGTATSSGDFFVPPGTFTASNVGYTNRLSLGGNLTVTISTGGQIGLVVFDGTAGHRLSLLTSSNTMTSSNGSTSISINRPDSTTVVTQTVTTSAPFIIPQNLLMTGTYTIVVQPSSSATGSITVAIYDVPADVTGSITINGSSVPVTISQPGQVGALTFAGTTGQSVTVHVTSNSINGVTVALKDPTGNTLSTQTSSSSSFNLSSATLAGSGTFSISISPTVPNTGGITISLTSP